MPPSGLGEAFDAVLAAARAQEPWAFQRIFDWLGRPVAAYLRGAGVEDPDGTANEVFLRVFGGVARFEGTEGRFRSWVFAIAHNLVIDDRRRRSRRPQAAVLDADEGPSAAAAEDLALVSLGDERIRALLASLPPDQRDVVLLRIVADFSIEDTAAALGKRAGAVKSLQHRATASLRRLLTEEA
ncbi:MAG TPA: RNA polymerase sigma factor [Acidimicrobiales bacterium]|nr:RNA polymerase sigma factor [Acidimicrobiales bacterium]